MKNIHTLIQTNRNNNSTIGSYIYNDNNNNVESMVVNVTPDIAKHMLQTNEGNRPLNESNVLFLAKEMMDENWQFDGSPIRFNNIGKLIDGQHRLNAIVKANKTYPLMVITGLEPTVFKTMDTGRKRSGADAVAIEGIEQSGLVSSTCKFIYNFNNKVYSRGALRMTKSLSNSELIDFYKSNMSIGDSIKFYIKFPKSKPSEKIISSSLLAGFHFLLSNIDEIKANEFLTKLYTGIGLEADSPITALRNKLLKAKINKTYKISHIDTINNISYAWYKFKNNEKVFNIKLPEDYEVEL